RRPFRASPRTARGASRAFPRRRMMKMPVVQQAPTSPWALEGLNARRLESADEPPPRKSRPPHGRRGWTPCLSWLTAALLLATLGGAGLWSLTLLRPGPRTALATHVVGYGTLPLTITARGELEAALNTDIVSHVKSNVNLKYAGP